MKFVEEHELNEFFDGEAGDIGIVLQGGLYNTTIRALAAAWPADAFGSSKVPLYVLNVTYPLVDKEFVRFCAGKKAILIVEEGQPDYIEQAVNTILRRADVQTKVHGKDMLPMAGEYTGGVVRDGVQKFIERHRPDLLGPPLPASEVAPVQQRQTQRARQHREPRARPAAVVLHRLPGAADLCRHEARRARAWTASCQRRHRLPPVLDLSAVRHRQHHHGLRARRRRRLRAQRQGRQARHRHDGRRRLLA